MFSKILSLLLLTTSVHSYGSGAPARCHICTGMKPGHGRFQSKPSGSLEITGDATLLENESAGGPKKFEIKIETPAEQFMGFLVQIRNKETNKPIGEIHTNQAYPQAAWGKAKYRYLNCGQCYPEVSGTDQGISPGSGALTHANPMFKSSLDFEWHNIFNFTGTAEVRATILKSYTNFWQNVKIFEFEV